MNKLTPLIIDEQFRSLLPPLSVDEREQLRESIREHGIIDPIITTTMCEKQPDGSTKIIYDVVIDGHHRYQIWKDIQNEAAEDNDSDPSPGGRKISGSDKPLPVKDIDFADGPPTRERIVSWIAHHQLSRRNLTPAQIAYLRGQYYLQEKRQDDGHGDQKSEGNGCTPIPTAVRLAEELGVSPRTIKNDAAFAKDINAITEAVGPEVKSTLLDGKNRFARKAVKKIAETAKVNPKRAREILKNPKPKPKISKPERKAIAPLPRYNDTKALERKLSDYKVPGGAALLANNIYEEYGVDFCATLCRELTKVMKPTCKEKGGATE